MMLRPLLHWRPLRTPAEGYTLILGVPWELRHLLGVNLRFIERMDLSDLDRIYVVFDRCRQAGVENIISATRRQFSRLPLAFDFHPPMAGRIARWVNQSKFYASLNWVTGLAHCRTKYAILHDFDLYPTAPRLFADIVRTMRQRGLRFSGVEYTHFDGLTDHHALIGTWELGIDVEWLRLRFTPVDCFHSFVRIGANDFDLDAFSRIQARTPDRALCDAASRSAFAHVTNLCSTYLRFTAGQRVAVAWRLHYLWYLEDLADGSAERMLQTIDAMQSATSPMLSFGGRAADFSDVHVTCANVLSEDLQKMEDALFGACRPIVRQYVLAFREFLMRRGRK